ncbi:MAG: NAD(P)H-hydrate dehydratase [Bacteroidota bacterium]|nr:NAD(P)H-hydrate dehydratase [Bacteroidota bacterium]
MAIKILSVEQIREADSYTILNEPISSIDLMERAATRCAEWLTNKITDQKVKVFCGMGNNGGDGLALARIMVDYHIDAAAFIVHHGSAFSNDCSKNLSRLESLDPGIVHHIQNEIDIPDIDQDDIVIDAIFGSGLSKPVTGLAGTVIDRINGCNAITIAIDFPSGLFADTYTNPRKGSIIEADYTLTFQNPKLAFFFSQNDRFLGDWVTLDIKIHPDFIAQAPAKNYLLTKQDIIPILKPRNRFSHKGNYGHALLIAGGKGKTGAAIIAAKAALRSGLGLLTVHLPEEAVVPLQASVPEAMISFDQSKDVFSRIPDLIPYSAIGIGPGIGQRPETAAALKLLIQEIKVPIVFDADALNILGDNRTWLSFLPAGCILTPHPKEFERLIGKTADEFERLKMQKEFSFRYNCYVVLKGAFTSITTPEGNAYFNPTGNPGMATGGSGDALTGIILSLLAQHYTPLESVLSGVYLHGSAGDIAAEELGYQSLIASDIVEYLSNAFMELSD